MIPQFKVQTTIAVDLSQINPPPLRMLREDYSLIANHDYVRLRGVGWKEYKRVSSLEEKAIKLIDSQSKTVEEFERIADKLIGEPEWGELNNFAAMDLGIVNVVLALYAFGCYPITSCRGHTSAGKEKHPLVVFFANPDRAHLVVGVAGGAGIGLCNVWADGEVALMAFGTNILDMQRFAKGLHRTFSVISRSKHKNEPVQEADDSQVNIPPKKTVTSLNPWLN